jgi:adenosine 3'-phospho 5'-phosphosulfate transporter B2
MDFISLATGSHRLLRQLEQDYATTTSQEARPLLSPTAEGELFLLATNFLLYVAMVIITIIVCKIYFPEALERGTSPVMTRSYSYRIAEEEDYYGSDVSDDDGDNSECLDSDGSDTDNDPNLLVSPNSTKFQNFMEFDQERMTKSQVLKRLLFCCIVLNITFVAWGVLQERMLTRRYPRVTGEYFTYSYFLVFTNRFWTLIMSGILLLYLKPRRSQSTIIYEYSFPSISNMLSSWCQYEALRYVSFPATTLFKAFKLAPVMMMGKILGNKSYPQYDYMVALVIGVGITLFMSSTDDLSFGYDIYGERASATWTGVMLLFFFLFFDSFTSQWQSRMFQRHPDLSMVELMFATSAFSVVLSLVTLVHTKELYPALRFVYRHSEIHLHFFMFSACSTLGQLFIFYTIKNFGAVVFTLIMTTRILLSIGLSCLIYGHHVGWTGFLGLTCVLGAVLYRIKRKAEGNQLLKWQGMGDDKAVELVQEWHEHVDM